MLKKLCPSSLLPLLRSLNCLRKKIMGGVAVRKYIRECADNAHVRVGYMGCAPGMNDKAHGGRIKLIELSRKFPESSPSCNIIYHVSSVYHSYKKEFLSYAKVKGLKLVLNQNGVAYPAWYGPDYEKLNSQMRENLVASDFVLYQSLFCKKAADHFLCERDNNYAIVYNSVNTEFYSPCMKRSFDPTAPVLLLAGNQYDSYRLDVTIKTLSAVVAVIPNTRLVVTGKLGVGEEDGIKRERVRTLLKKLDLMNNVTFIGSYSQEQAPAIYQQGDILVHPQYNDNCPGVVLEAMACGLPIVYSKTGGVYELVGDNAGIGIESQESWESIYPPDPSEMADGVIQIVKDYCKFSLVARQRAVEKFDVEQWVTTHHKIFEDVLNK